MASNSDGSVVRVGGGGIGAGTLLTIVFVVLKALGYISWSWWWVFAPLWLPWLVFLGIGLIVLICATVWALIEEAFHAHRER